MTEDEAKTRWCPFARTLETADFAAAAAVNREPGSYDQQGNETVVIGGRHRCIASACMAWRWREEKRTAAFLEAVQAHMQAQAKPNFNTATQAVYAERGGSFERTEGFCGLAGSPS